MVVAPEQLVATLAFLLDQAAQGASQAQLQEHRQQTEARLADQQAALEAAKQEAADQAASVMVGPTLAQGVTWQWPRLSLACCRRRCCSSRRRWAASSRACRRPRSSRPVWRCSCRCGAPSHVRSASPSVAEASSSPQEVAVETQTLAASTADCQQQVAGLQEGSSGHAQQLAQLEVKVVSNAALQQLADQVGAVEQAVGVAKEDAEQSACPPTCAGGLADAGGQQSQRAVAGHSAYQQQASINEQSAALQKLVDLQAADEIVTTRCAVPSQDRLAGSSQLDAHAPCPCRMAAANVDGVAGAVTALSREVARSQASVKELQAQLQDMRWAALLSAA